MPTSTFRLYVAQLSVTAEESFTILVPQEEGKAVDEVVDTKTVAKVVQADIEASNGVVHAIDKVLI